MGPSLKSNAGFTLIESLFVFSIFTVIATVSFIMFRPTSSVSDEKLFFTLFKSDMYFAQAYAMTNKSYVNVNIIPHQHRYYIKDQSGKILIDREYSEHFLVDKGSQYLYYRYLPTGNINTFGTLYMYAQDQHYKIIFYIGKGRIHVSEI